MDVAEADKPGYIKLMRESRISLAADGIYDKKNVGFIEESAL